jgi:hypothetical protein
MSAAGEAKARSARRRAKASEGDTVRCPWCKFSKEAEA